VTLAIKMGTAPAGDISGGLPEGWALTTLQDACEINPPKASKDSLPADAPVTFVPMPAVDAEEGAITKPQVRRFSEVRKGFTSFRDGDVIMAKITPCMENGKSAIARNLMNGLGFGSTEFHVFRSTGATLPEFVYHYIRQDSYRRAAEDEMTGSVGQKRVPQAFLEMTELPLPPLPEQIRIVRSLTELLDTVKASHEKLSRVPAILRRFRQAVLAAACSGRLTEDWRVQRASKTSATEFLRAILAMRPGRVKEQGIGAVRKPTGPDESQLSDVPEEWAITSIDEVSCMVTSGSRGWAKYYAESGPLLIRAQDINTDRLQRDGIAHVELPDNAEGIRTRVYLGDLLVTITGANVTKAALLDSEVGESYVSQHVALVRPVDPSIAQFLYLWIVSPRHGRAKLLDDAYGAGKPGLNLDNIKETTLALPSLEEQREIVRRVDALFKLADTIEMRIAIATRRADKLTESILAKAFRGELVPTEAELARREGREYEPASVLLERIKAEKASLDSGKALRSKQPAPRGGKQRTVSA
jgi:type I restriction enzyme S subunit